VGLKVVRMLAVLAWSFWTAVTNCKKCSDVLLSVCVCSVRLCLFCQLVFVQSVGVCSVSWCLFSQCLFCQLVFVLSVSVCSVS
jgi:hypothetical protein